MLSWIWLFLILLSTTLAGVENRLDALSQGCLNAAKAAVMDVALPLAGAMALWLGMVRLAEKSGLIQVLARLVRPIMHRLFPDVPPEHPAMAAMVLNIAANMLGVSNAATPFGLKAMEQLESINPRPGTATNAMCTFLALNTSSVQLLPATAITLLAINGSHHPTAIVGSTLLSTGTAALSALVIVKLLQRWGPFRLKGSPETGAAPAKDPASAPATAAPAPPLAMARWGPWVIALEIIFFAGVLVTRLVAAGPPAGFLHFAVTFLQSLSPLAVPFFLGFFPLFAAAKGIPVYTEFVEGAKEGMQVALRILPYLVGMLVAIAAFRESGALDLAKQAFRPALDLLQVPVDLLPMILMRPLSGSGSIAVLADLVKQFGPDSLLSYMAATIYGSAETTFYVVAVYFGAVGITRTRHAIPAGLLADLVGVLAAVWTCRWLFGG